MLIILEGPDGAGKTTLAEKIAKSSKYMLLHRSKPKTEEEKQNMMAEYLQVIRSGKNMIFDRCWYSEMVYGRIMRDDSCITYPEMYELERLLLKCGAILIYCTDKPETLWKRCGDRGEDYIKDYKKFLDICKAYDELMKVPHLIPVVKYAYEDM